MFPLIQSIFRRVRSCDWIEVAALPFAVTMIEAQPLIIILWLAGLELTGKNEPIVLDPATIVLLLLGFRWWAMGVRQFQQSSSSEVRAKMLHLMGLCLALALVIGIHLPLIDQPLALFLAILVVLWCWQRSKMQTQGNRRDEHLKSIFQQACFVMLTIVVLTAIVPSITVKLLAPLTLALPLFFLSGLVTFSLLRLKATAQAYQKRLPNVQRIDPTRLWSILVLLFWTSVVALAFLGERVAYSLVAVVLSPLLTLLARGYLIVVAFLDALLQLKPRRPVHLPEMIKLHRQLVSPFHNPVLVVILTLTTFGTMVLILVIAVKIWSSNYRYTQEDEIRTGIAPRAVLRERQQKRASSAREQLEPTSVRAHYREFLRLMTRYGIDLERLPPETPSEYQKRLYDLLGTVSQQQHERVPNAILDELTRAYIQVRYGGKDAEDHPYTYWQTHIRAFVKRFRQFSRKRAHSSIKE